MLGPMKLLTHVVFSAGLGYALLASIPGGPGVLTDAVFAVILSYAVNYLIDILGHRRKDGWSVRSPLTHSIFTAPVWGVAASYVLWAVGAALGLGGGVGLYLVVGAAVAYSHLFLDSMTEGGVYLTTGRIALAHFRNGNLLLNVAFLLGGLALFLF